MRTSRFAVYEDVCSAIRNRSLLEFDYGGGTWLVEPHCHGFGKTGKEFLRAYQVDGYSGSSELEGWKLFDLAKAGGLYEADGAFAARSGFSPHDPAMVSVHCHV